jgi:hypothetical protein
MKGLVPLIVTDRGRVTCYSEPGHWFRQERRCWFPFDIVVHEGGAVGVDFLTGGYANIGPGEVSGLVELHIVLRLWRLIMSARVFLQRRRNAEISRAALIHYRR